MTTFIPYQSFKIKTRLTHEAARQKLVDIVEPRKIRWGFSRDHAPFEGEVDGSTFKISRVLRSRNSFLPILVGQIQDDLDASTLQITARLNLATLILWPLLLVIFMISTIFAAGVTDSLVILFFALFFYGLPTLLFNYELNKAKKLLNEQFETDTFSLP